MNTRKGVLLLILVFVVLVFGIWGFATGFKYLTAESSGKAEAERQIQSAEYRIFSYDYFFDKAADITGFEAAYIAQHKKLKQLEKGSQEYNQTLSNIAALETQIITTKEQYNKDVEKEGTRGQFKADGLPDHYDLVLPEIPDSD